MFRILRIKMISRPLVWIMIFSFSLLTTRCYFFRVTRSTGEPQSTIPRLQQDRKTIVLHLEEHSWLLSDITMNDNSMEGVISEYAGSPRKVREEAANRYRSDESDVLNEVHVYVTRLTDPGNGRIIVPVEAINKINIYDKARGATAASWTFGMVGVTVGAMALLTVIVLLTKSSCPFVYAYNGSDYELAGEIFSGATQPGLERDDYLPLPDLVPSNGTCSLKLTNEVKEIQSINSASLIVVDHPKNGTVLIDKYGEFQAMGDVLPPSGALNRSSGDILNSIRYKDTLSYSADLPGSKDGVEEIILEFPKPEDAKSARLVIRAKNSFWLDVLFTRFHGLFGDKYDLFAGKQESTSGKKLRQYMLEQKMPLLVYIEKDDKWQLADYFNIAGPMAFRDDVLKIDLKGVNSDVVRVKLETGFMFWDIDFAGMDFSSEQQVSVTEIPFSSLTHGNDGQAGNRVSGKDDQYLVLRELNDEMTISFKEPERKSSGRSYFLHTSGYYKILREESGQPADTKLLKSFRKPGRFPEFSRELYDRLQLDPEKHRALLN